MSILLSTTGDLATVIIDDLGGREFTHPTTSIVLTDEFNYTEIRESEDLGVALDAGYITIINDGDNIADSSALSEVQPQIPTSASEAITISTSDPGASDDSSLGHFVGKRWLNTTTKKLYVAEDVSIGSAIWFSVRRNRANYKLIQDKADFPAPVSNVITLLANHVYEINGAIDIGTDRIQLADGVIVLGTDPFVDEMTYTGTGDMFTGVDCSVEISSMNIHCLNGRIFNVSTTVAKTKAFLFNRIIASTCEKVGVVEGLKLVSIKSCSFDSIAAEGILSTGANNGDFLWFDTIVKDVQGGALFNLVASVWDIWHADRSEIHIPIGSQVGISGLPNNGNINVKGFLTRNNWLNDGEYVDSAPVKDIRVGGTKWDFAGNGGVPDISDNIATGFYSAESNAVATDIVTQNVWVKVAGTTVGGGNNIRFGTSISNRLVYEGESEYKGNVTVTGSGTVSSGSDNYEITVFKNGAKLPNVKVPFNVVNGKPNGFALSAPIDALTNDYFEVYIRSISGNKDVTITDFQIAIG